MIMCVVVCVMIMCVVVCVMIMCVVVCVMIMFVVVCVMIMCVVVCVMWLVLSFHLNFVYLFDIGKALVQYTIIACWRKQHATIALLFFNLHY